MGRFFSPRMLAGRSVTIVDARRTLVATDPPARAAAIRDMDRHGARLDRGPVLVIDSDLDVSLPWTGHEDSRATSRCGGRPPPARIENLECRGRSTRPGRFLAPAPGASADSGLRCVAVLGDARRRAIDNGIHPRLDLITRYAWGEIWTRPGSPPNPAAPRPRLTAAWGRGKVPAACTGLEHELGGAISRNAAGGHLRRRGEATGSDGVGASRTGRGRHRDRQ